MPLKKALLLSSIAAFLYLPINIFAQVSNVEGIEPIEGVKIPKAQSSTEIKFSPIFKDCNECPEMVTIPEGSFFMGSKDGDSLGQNNERPQHGVQIQSFAIGKYEITQEEWKAVMGNNPSYFKGSKLPVENVSWDDAQLFVKKISQKTGKNYRLPSEAEWEYVARGGSSTLYSWGNDASELSDYAWFSQNARAVTLSVGLKKPNLFGIYDMSGNVWEWTQDCWNESYIGAPSDGSTWTTGDCSRRVVRGGSWANSPRNVRTASRDRYFSTIRDNVGGFRVARTI